MCSVCKYKYIYNFSKVFFIPHFKRKRNYSFFKLFHPCVSVCLSLCLSVHNKRVSMISRKLFITDAWNFKILFVQPSHTCIVRLIFIEIRRQFPVNDNSVYIKPNFWNKFSSKFFQQLLYTGFFSPCVIFALLHLLIVSPCHEFAQTQLCYQKDNIRHWISPSLKFACWQQGLKGRI